MCFRAGALSARYWRRRPGVGRRAGPPDSRPAVVVQQDNVARDPRAEPTVAAPVRDRSGAGQARRTSSLHPGLFSVSIVTPRSSSQIAVPADRTVVKIEWRVGRHYASRKAPASLPHSKNVLSSAEAVFLHSQFDHPRKRPRGPRTARLGDRSLTVSCTQPAPAGRTAATRSRAGVGNPDCAARHSCRRRPRCVAVALQTRRPPRRRHTRRVRPQAGCRAFRYAGTAETRPQGRRAPHWSGESPSEAKTGSRRAAHSHQPT